MTYPRTLPQVLYIADSEEARALVGRLLADKYVVLEAANPLDGIQLAEDTHPNLILLDNNLPHITGNEAATRLRKILPQTPIVIVSGDLSDGSRERALAAGAAGFIPKPIDDDFPVQIDEYLDGKVEKLEQPELHLQAYQQELAEKYEGTIRQLTVTIERNKHLLQQNERMFVMLETRHRMLETAARVGQLVTSILDLDDLLRYTVDIICSEFDFYYSGIFLLSDDRKWAVLRAGYGIAGRRMVEQNHRLPVDNHSMIGRAILRQQAQIASDVAGDGSRFKNPLLPDTRSEMALPLIAKSEALGALTVQSDKLNAFAEEDITSLQVMADHIAIALSNAQLLDKLAIANAELLRTKTYEAIATATGEAIHWVGNKATPIPGSIKRVREDLRYLLALIGLLNGPAWENTALRGAVETVKEEAELAGINLKAVLDEMSTMKANRLNTLVSIESLMEDLDIAENSAKIILDIKEGLIGPARQRNDAPVSLNEMITSTVGNMGLPPGVVELAWTDDMPPIFGDTRQVEQVFNNLIKNAWEALEDTSEPKIWVYGRSDIDPDFVLVTVKDNGPGIPKEIQEKIWVSFFTTKGGSGGTGLGLSSVMQIVNQHGGRIMLESEPGKGAKFSVRLPVYKNSKEDK